MKILCVFGKCAYGDPDREEGYEYGNFIPAFRKLNYEVLFLESWDRRSFGSFRELNEKLLLVVEEKRPDIIFFVLIHYEIWIETLEVLKDSGICAMVNWATDDSWKYSQFSKLIAPAFHAFTTTYPKAYAMYHQDGISNVLLTQWAANSTQLKSPTPGANCKYAVSFVGSAYGKRRKWIDNLRKRGIKIECFGHGWSNGPISSEKVSMVMHNSIISLNFANSSRFWDEIRPKEKNQIKARIFEVPGNGGFLLTEWADGIGQYYIPNKEIITFEGINECAEKTNYYLNNLTDRDSIALAGYERTKKDHTYDQRLSKVLAFAIDRKENYFNSKGINKSGKIDWNKFEEASKRHMMDRKLLVVTNIMTRFCSMIFGPVRGPRAARRLLFEISWRLVGANTYSAGGWPGRCFDE